MSVLQDAYNFFLGQGYTPNAAAGISAGLYAESRLNPNIVNPTSGAFGIEQALGSRQRNLFTQYGSNPSLSDQLSFVAQELPTNGGASINSASSPQDALSKFINLFERPGPGAAGDIQRGTVALSQLNPGNGGVGPSDGAAYGSDAWYLNNPLNAADTMFNNLLGLFGGKSINTPSGAIGLGGQPSAPQGAHGWTDELAAILDPKNLQTSLSRGTFIVVGIGLLFIGGLILLASSLVKAANDNPGAVAAIA